MKVIRKGVTRIGESPAEQLGGAIKEMERRRP
jgi:hypothetical protein